MALMVMSCEHPVDINPGPEVEQPDQEVEKNTYILNDEKKGFGSICASNLGEYLCIAATPTPGVDDFEAMFEQDEFFYVAISPLLNGKQFDLNNENELYTIISSLEGAFLESVTPSTLDEIESGSCTVTCKNGLVEAEVQVVLADGAILSVKLSTEDPGIVVNQNIFSLAGNDKPVRAAFSREVNGMTEIYLTPAGIEFFDELSITTYYAYIILDSNKCHGKSMTVEDVVAVGYADNLNAIVVDSREVTTTGSLNVAADPDDERHYVVSADLDFNGTSLKLRFDGKTYDTEKEEIVENKVIYQGETLKIKKASIDYMPDVEGVYRVMITTSKDDIIYISLPVSFLDGNAHGFSQSSDLYIEYKGVVYSKANGSSGTVTVGIDGNTLKVDATNYSNLQIIYVGGFETNIFY